MKTMNLLVIRHFGLPFFNSPDAVLLATGALHHLVLLKL
jgi:hypothetical protein